jgi:hypothetical protein
MIGYQEVKNLAVSALYTPGTWSNTSQVLYGLYSGNLTLYNLNPGSALETSDVQATLGIKCSEKQVQTPTLADYLPNLEPTYNASQILGDVFVYWDMICGLWQMEAKEIYEGDFQVKTKNPILFAGNTHDPLTAFASAKNMSSGFEGSGLVELHGYGVSSLALFQTFKLADRFYAQHSTLAQPSLCIINYFQQYFANGTLPESGATCEPDIPLFSNLTIYDLLAELQANSSTHLF